MSPLLNGNDLSTISVFLSGVYMATFAASGMIFFKVWRRTSNTFFQLFGLACMALAIERIPLIFVKPSQEENSWVYLFRLTAFVLILFAILSANRKDNGPSR